MSVRRVAPLIVASLVLLSSAARAQQSGELKVKVPFDFMVGRLMFPAGEYALQESGPSSFVLHACRGSAFVVLTSRSIHPNSQPSRGGLVFRQAAHHYHLRRFWVDAASGQAVAQGSLPARQGTRVVTVAFKPGHARLAQ